MGLFKDTKDWKNNKKKENKKNGTKAHNLNTYERSMDGNDIYSKKRRLNQLIALIFFVAIIVTVVMALYVARLQW